LISKVIPEGLHGNTWFDLQCPKINNYYITEGKADFSIQYTLEMYV